MSVQPAVAIDLMSGMARIVGLSVLSAAVAAGIALLYRWYARATVPEGLTVLAGLAIVAIYLNTTTALSQVIGGAAGLLDLDTALVNTTTFVIAGFATTFGRRIGDRIAREGIIISGVREFDTDVSRVVKAVGRVITVTLPDEIEDIEGYDPVLSSTKEELAGKTLLFPRRLTVAELRDRLVARLKDDYGVGHVDLDIDEEGTIEYLAVGSRAAGIGPTLAPGMAATAVRADPAYSASPGDIVQVWRTDPQPERIATAELRGTVDDIVTLALDETDARMLDPTVRYRLVTLPAEPRAELEFASMLRAAAETMGVTTVEAGSGLEGKSLGELDVIPIAIRPADGDRSIEAIPSRSRVLVPGDLLYAIARPEALRRLEMAAVAGSGDAVEAESSL